MSEGPPRRDVAAAASLAAASALALGLPPEVHPETGPIVAALLALGHVAAGARLRIGPVVLAFAIVALNLATSLAPGRGVETVARLGLGLGALALAARLPVERARALLLPSLAAVGAGLGALGVAQWLVLLPAELDAARRAALPDPWLIRLAQERAFGTHVVPAALGGALVVALAAALAGASGRDRSRIAALAYGAAALAAAAGLVATRSIGAAIGAFAGAGVAALLFGRGWPRGRLVALVVVSLVVLAAVVALRPPEALALSGADSSVALRLGNWRGAALVAREEPITGVGLGAFRSLYPEVRRGGDSETAYAHNSWLQLVAEGGLVALALLVLGAVAFWRRRPPPGDAASALVFAGVAAFVAHNLVDFTAYLPGILVPAAALAGTLRTPPRSRFAPAPPDVGRAGGILVALGLALLCAVWIGEAGSRRALETALEHVAPVTPAAPTEALAAAEAAAARAPWNATLVTRAARGMLAVEPGDDALERAAALAARAARLDPRSPEPWHARAEVALARGEPTRAWRWLRAAHERHPVDPLVNERLGTVRDALERSGLTDAEFGYGGEIARANLHPWTLWDDLLAAAGLAFVLIVAWRIVRPGAAPAAAVASALLLVIAPWGEGGALPGTTLAALALASAAAIAWLARRSEAAPASRPLVLAFVPALAIAAASAAASVDAAAARDGLVRLALTVGLVVVSASLAARWKNWPTLALTVYVATCLALAALVVVQRGLLALGVDLSLMPHPLHVRAGGVPAGDFLHPGHLGTYLVGGAVALLVPLAAGRGRRVPRLVFAAFLVVVAVLPGARATALALVAAALVAAFLPLPRAKRRVLLAGLAAAGIAALAGAAWRFASVADAYAWSRVKIWAGAVGALAERPLLGAGPGAVEAIAPRHLVADPTEIARFGKVWSEPHSDPLHALVALGVVGGLALIAAIVWTGARAWRGARASFHDAPELAAALTVVASFAAHGLVDDLAGVRPAIAIVGAVLLGAAYGRACGSDDEGLAPSAGARVALAALVAIAFADGAVRSWSADRVARAGEPRAAAEIDPWRARYWLSSARLADGAPLDRVAVSLERTRRAELVSPARPAVRRERARVLSAACLGPLAQPDTCEDALAAWTAVAEVAPADVFARRARARLAVRMERRGIAEDELRRALELEPDYLGARLDLARLLREAGRVDEADAQVRQVLERGRRLAEADAQSGRDEALRRLATWEMEELRSFDEVERDE